MSGIRFISLFVFITISTISFGQNKKLKVIKEEVLKIGEFDSYSRAIQFSGGELWMASSDGKLRAFNLKDNSVNFVSETEGLEELRDVYVNDSLAIAMMSGSNGKLLIYKNGEERIVESLSMDSVFLDVIDIRSTGFGAMMGDPKNGFFSLYFTRDFGQSWQAFKQHIPSVQGEAGFAASGSTLKMTSDTSFVFVTGGLKSRMIYVEINESAYTSVNYSSVDLPFKQGEGSGAFSFEIVDSVYVVVGGDYLEPDKGEGTCFVSGDCGKTWKASLIAPNGYRSCVIYDEINEVLYCSGRNGIDYSLDNGMHWKSLSKSAAFCLILNKNKLYGTTKNGEVKIFSIKMK